MKRVLVVTLPEKGHYHPLLGPVEELARRDVEVTLACTIDIARELTATGVVRVAIPPGARSPSSDLRGAALAAVLDDPHALARWIRTLLVDSVLDGIEPLRVIMRDVRPDVVAIDTMAYSAAIAADLERIPWVGWSTSLNPVVADDHVAPALNDRDSAASVTSDNGDHGVVDPQTRVTRETARDRPSQLVQTLLGLDRERHAVFAERGIAARFRVSDVLSPRGTAVFATDALVGESFDSTVHLVGPSLGGARGGERFEPTDRPLVYISFGSQAWHQPRRFDRLFEAVAALDLTVIAAMGDLAADYRARVPRNVRCADFVDQLATLRRASAIVTHGGANTVMEACAFGVPLLVSPLCNDQPHNARFIERAGCGIALDLATCSHTTLVDAMRRLVANGPERAAMTRVAASYAGRSGACGAADLAERACR